jgi:hypothetical protein
MLRVKNYQSSMSTFKSSTSSKEKRNRKRERDRERETERVKEKIKFFKGDACFSFLSLRDF